MTFASSFSEDPRARSDRTRRPATPTDMIALLSANPNYPPEAVTDPEAIIGRVVWMWQGV